MFMRPSSCFIAVLPLLFIHISSSKISHYSWLVCGANNSNTQHLSADFLCPITNLDKFCFKLPWQLEFIVSHQGGGLNSWSQQPEAWIPTEVFLQGSTLRDDQYEKLILFIVIPVLLVASFNRAFCKPQHTPRPKYSLFPENTPLCVFPST